MGNMAKNNHSELSEETMAFIDSICMTGNTPMEHDNVKRLMLDIILSDNMLISLNADDVKGLFHDGDKITAFEANVDASKENRMEQLVGLLKQKCENVSTINKMMLCVFCPADDGVGMEELEVLNNWFSSLNSDLEIKWGIALENSLDADKKLRGTMFVQ